MKPTALLVNTSRAGLIEPGACSSPRAWPGDRAWRRSMSTTTSRSSTPHPSPAHHEQRRVHAPHRLRHTRRVGGPVRGRLRPDQCARHRQTEVERRCAILMCSPTPVHVRPAPNETGARPAPQRQPVRPRGAARVALRQPPITPIAHSHGGRRCSASAQISRPFQGVHDVPDEGFGVRRGRVISSQSTTSST